MYTRQVEEPPKKIIRSGKAQFGTFSNVSPKLDIKGMHAPYAGVPLPAFISNLRIKSRLTYTYNLGQYFGMTEFYDFKVFGLCEVIFWNKESGKRNSYHAVMPGRRRFVPLNTKKGLCASYQQSRRARLFWEDDHDFFKNEFLVKGDKVRPSAKGKMISLRKDQMHSDWLFVNPSPAKSRCTATWLSPMTIKGSLTTFDPKENPKNVSLPKAETGTALVSMNRSYFKFHTKHNFVKGIGTVGGKNIIFNIVNSNIDAADDESYNSNGLFINGDLTPLPPVVITHPFGVRKSWIIQDTEGMIDLTFTPVSIQTRVLNIILIRNSSTTIYGTFEGVLVSKDGEKVNLKNFPGIVTKNMVRT